MNKPTIILLLILTIVSCGKGTELPINESQFRNKTFSLFSESEKDTLTIEFQDSTHQIFELRQKNIPWRISNYDNSNFLVLDNRVIGIKKTDKDEFECTYIGLIDNPFMIVERKFKWKKEQIYGTWVEEKYVGTDSTDFPPPPIQPENNKWNWPPSHTITETKIELDFYDKFESEIEINNTGEFIQMNLNNSVGLGIREELWQIKHLSDSLMIVDKRVDNILSSHGEKSLTNIRLIKKR